MNKAKTWRGLTAIIEVVDLIGEHDISDHDFAKIIVDHELEIRELCSYSLAKLTYQLHPREREEPPTSIPAMLWAQIEQRRRELATVSLTPRDAVRHIASLAVGMTAEDLGDLITIMAYAMAALEHGGAGESP